MTSSKSTKRALLTSVSAIVLCLVMLIGTTFAWFTDSASTGVNKIQAGNLDIELEYKNSTTKDFTKADKNTPVFDESALWEPGHVEYVVLKVSNAGTLALKYKLGINIASETGSTSVDGKAFKLSEYIRFAVIDGDKGDLGRDDLVATAGAGDALNVGYTSGEGHLAKGNSAVVTLVVWMPTTVGNEANHKTDAAAPTINLGISVVAGQDTVEEDSFGPDYDQDAIYPVADSVGLSEALENATDGSTIVIDSGEFALTGGAVAASATISGAGSDKTVLKTDSQNYVFSGDNVIIKDVTIDGNDVSKVDNNGAIKVTGDNAVLDSVKLVGGGQNTYGHTLRVDPKTGTVTTVRNSVISGAFRGIQLFALDGTLLIENTTLAPQCYCLNVDGGTGKLVVNNSKLMGWTSYTSSVESATFTDCTFEVNTGAGSYKQNCVRAYTTTTFVNCDFGDEFWFGAANNAVTVTFENCRYMGTLITESNVSQVLEATDNAKTTVVVR